MIFQKKRYLDSNVADNMNIIDDTTPCAIREAFSTLCTNIMYLPIADKCKKLAITSANAHEGKTYTSINLAISFAYNFVDKKILLIDMDIRKSSVSKHFKHLEDMSLAKNGLSEYLLGFSEKPNVVQTKVPGLSVLFAGERCSAPQELITSQKMTDLIKSLESDYDLILIDTPPLIVSDARLISDLVNGYLISTRANYSTVHSIANTEEELKKVDARIFGIVLTEYKPKFRRRDLKYTIYSDYSK